MTRFIDVPSMNRLVADIGLPRFIDDLSVAIGKDFARWHDFDKTARLATHSPLGVIELMPVADARRYAFKYVNGHPDNALVGLSTVMAFGVLSDVATGYPVLLSELTVATAMRTAATSLLAARLQARPESRRMALIGNGAQSEFQAIAFHCLFGIREIRIYDRDPNASRKLMHNLAHLPTLRVVPANSIADAVRGADIVTTLTAEKTHADLLTPDMLEPGMHINAVGGDCPGKTELHPDVLRQANILVEYAPQTRIEGEIQRLPDTQPVCELWQAITQHAAARRSQDDITLFDSVGFALEDFSTLCYVHAAASERQLGCDIELVPSLDDPKDLFRHTLAPGQRLKLQRAA